MDIRTELKEFVAQTFLFAQDRDLKDEDSFFELGVIDSTGLLELVVFLEDHFGIKIDDSDLIPENLDSVQAVTAFVQRQIRAQQAEG